MHPSTFCKLSGDQAPPIVAKETYYKKENHTGHVL